ncbi:hypothetical protein SMC26_29100 [Actinomadura fulvescens]|uniref:Uncharacterized protein n=1 Tax=Actinomadura fulvescens TaxID=46160 RepID=A0ABN3PYG1_9ACTN
MGRADQAAARLPQVKQLAEQHGNALRSSFGLLLEGALVGPAADRLLEDLAERHRDVRACFYTAFDAVERVAAQADGGPPRVSQPYIPGPPRGGRRAPVDVRSGSPDGLHRLGVELGRAGREWEDAGAALARILDGLGLNTSPGHDVRRAGTWVAGRQRDVHRRRDELLKADQEAAVQSAMGVVRGLAAGLGQDRRNGVLKYALKKTWHDYTHRYLAGVWDGSKDLGLYALASNPATAPVYMMTDWGGWVRRGPVGQAKGLAQGAQHPVEFGKAMVNWDLWKKDPLRAYGTMVPSIIIGAATMGTGSGSGAGSRLAAAISKAKLKDGIDALRTAGPGAHGVQRHLDPTDDELKRRLGTPKFNADGSPKLKNGFVVTQDKIDPMTGTTKDGVTGKLHKVGPYATRFNDPKTFQQAEKLLRERALKSGDYIQKAPIEELLGKNGHKRFTGYYIDPHNPSKYLPIDFRAGTIKAIFKKDANGNLYPYTMYPDPAPGMHP